MLKPTITTVGGATRDIMFYTDDVVFVNNPRDLLRQKLMAFEYGAKLYSDQVYLTYGGGGANTAVSFASLGVRSQCLASIGDDFIGHDLIKHFKNRGVSSSLMQRQKNIGSGLSFIVNSGSHKEHVIFAYRGANDRLDLSPAKLRQIKTPWLYLASLSGKFRGSLNSLMQHVEKNKIKLAWNPGHAQLKLGLKKLTPFMKRTSVFIVNRDEALELLVRGGNSQVKNDIKYLLRHLHASGQRITVITDGPKGAYIFDGKKVYFHPALKRKGINTTGAGDSFGSGFVAGLIRHNWNIDKALRLAILNSNSVIMKVGAQEGLLTVSDLRKYKL